MENNQIQSLIPGYITSPSIDKIGPAFFQLLKDVGNPQRNKENPHFKSRYADLEGVLRCIEPHIEAAHCVYTQALTAIDGFLVCTSTILHDSMQTISQESRIPFVGTDPQKAASGFTYLRRIATKGIFGMTDTDDDGNEASGREKEPIVKRTAQAQPAPNQPPQATTATSLELEQKKEVDRIRGFLSAAFERPPAEISELVKQFALGFLQVNTVAEIPLAIGKRLEIFQAAENALAEASSPEQITAVTQKFLNHPRDLGRDLTGRVFVSA